MIDSHCHLDPSTYGGDEGVDAVVARAVAAGVTHMLSVGSGYGFDSAARAVAVARRHANVRASVGLHPHDAKDFTDARFADLLDMSQLPEVLALGEMGLDFHYDSSPRDTQRAVFRAQLREARRRQVPVIIHDRESGGETLRILDDESAWDTGVLFHCYTGNLAMMEQIVARGGWISIPGIVTFKTAGEMAEVAARVPDDRLLVETDAPFLTPVPHRGKKNEPAYVAHTLAKVAALRGRPVAEMESLTVANTRRFFRWASS
ncbi:MAG: TatD family hydrolase [Deltaproteobacteria bacterium]|nr:TatD family hydrolase [Deltaproteobacteria bacterium]